MARGFGRSGLPLGYRIGYRFRIIGVSVFGPAQLGEGNDPKMRLERERAARIAAAHADRDARAGRDSASDGDAGGSGGSGRD